MTVGEMQNLTDSDIIAGLFPLFIVGVLIVGKVLAFIAFLIRGK